MPTGIRSEQILDGEVKGEDIADEVAGGGLIKDSDGNLQINTDEQTLTVEEDVLKIKENGVSITQLSSYIDGESKFFNAFSINGYKAEDLMMPLISGINILNNTILDTVSISEIQSVLWQIILTDNENTVNKYCAYISVFLNETSTPNFSVWAINESGDGIPNVNFNISIDSNDFLNLIVSANNSQLTQYSLIRIIGENISLQAGDFIIDIPAGHWIIPDNYGALFEETEGTKSDICYHNFDDTTEEFLRTSFQLPYNLNENGFVIFEIIGTAATPDVDKYINLKIYHKNISENTDWDVEYDSFETEDLLVNDTQKIIKYIIYKSVSELNWTANDWVKFQISRIQPNSGYDNLIGDWRLINFRIRIPRLFGKQINLENREKESIIDIPAGYWISPKNNPAEFMDIEGTNSNLSSYNFDDTTEEFIETSFSLPPNIDINKNIIFEIIGTAATPDTDKYINLKIYHQNTSNNNDWDINYESFETGELLVNENSAIKKYIISKAGTELNWYPNNLLRLKLSRISVESGYDNLIGDWQLLHFRIRIPKL